MEKFANRFLHYPTLTNLPNPKKSFFWPVYIWQVLSPKNDNSLNVFQKTILDLYNVHYTDPDDIAKLMGLEKELVLFIIATELMPNNWLDASGRLTQNGIKEISYSNKQLEAGYMFQDAFSDQLWPRVVPELKYIEPVSIDNERVTFQLKRNKDRKDSPFILFKRNSKFHQPELTTFKEQLRQANIDIHNLRVREELEREPMEDHHHFDEVEILDPEPIPAYVLIWIVKDSAYHWLVSDPSGMAKTSDWMKEAVEEKAKSHNPFAQYIRNFLGYSDKNETWEETNLRIENESKFRLMTEFPGIDRIKNLDSILAPLLRIKAEVDKGKKHHEIYDNLIIHTQKIFECCLQWMLTKWPLNNPQKISRNWKSEDVETALKASTTILQESELEELKTVRSGKIYWAAEKKNESLKSLLAAVLLSLPEHNHHPMQRLSVTNNVVSTILAVAKMRNAAAHASKRTVNTDQEAITHYADFSIQWVKKLLKNKE